MVFSKFLVGFAATLAITATSFAQTYDAKADFSTASNPNGLWTYGWSSSLTGTVTDYPDVETTETNATGWTDNSFEVDSCPFVLCYSGTVTDPFGSPPDSMILSPGPEGQYSHCEWTAPVSGTYGIQGSFMAAMSGGPSAYLLKNGQTIESFPYGAENVLNSYSIPSVALQAGDTIGAVVGIGYSFSSANLIFSLTISTVSVSGTTGTVKPGSYAGLIVGSGSASGLLTAQVRKSVAFSAVMDIDGKRVPFAGVLSGSSVYSGTATLTNGSQVPVQLGTDGEGDLMANINYKSTDYLATAGLKSNTSSAGGRYSFVVTSGTADSGQPQGAGFGSMRVKTNGDVSVSGVLADGKPFAVSSAVVSGSVVPLYVLKSSGELLAGNLIFQDVPDVSDCSGTLLWSMPANHSHSAYADGFSASTEFTAVQFNRVIAGLNRTTASFTASGGDLPQGSPSSASVVLHGDGMNHRVPILTGAAQHFSLTLVPGEDSFFGSFLDPVNNKVRSFAGALLPKSRSGAGYFFSQGLSGEVDIAY